MVGGDEAPTEVSPFKVHMAAAFEHSGSKDGYKEYCVEWNILRIRECLQKENDELRVLNSAEVTV